LFQAPIIIKIVETPEKGLGDILLEALGLTGALALGAVLCAVALGALLYWIRSR
jgi:hypothetical protein